MLPVVLALLLGQASQSPARALGVPIGKGKEQPKITITSPPGGWSASRMLTVKGTVSDPTIDPVVVSINGDRYLLRTFSGKFARAFPAAAGKNVITVSATNRGGTRSAQVTCFAQIPPVPLKAVLTSDTDGVYTDLHIYEPTDGSVSEGRLDLKKMAHVFWAQTESPSGGTFMLNEQGGDFDQPGYGPYLYIHRAPPKGVYLVTTNYWPSGDKAHTQAFLNLTLFEGTPQEMKRRIQVPLATPGTTRALAWINVLGEGRALIYAPGSDARPTEASWPRNLDEVVAEMNSPGGDDGI